VTLNSVISLLLGGMGAVNGGGEVESCFCNFPPTPIASNNISLNKAAAESVSKIKLFSNESIDLQISELGPSSVFVDLLSPTVPLQMLSLRSCGISDNVCASLFQSLKTNKTIVCLDLFGNKISDVACEVLSESLLFNSTLSALCLSSNMISDKGIKYVCSSLVPLLCDKNDAAKFKQKGMKVTVFKNKNFREANSSLRSLNFSNNRLTTSSLRDLIELFIDIPDPNSQAEQSQASLLAAVSSQTAKQKEKEKIVGSVDASQAALLEKEPRESLFAAGLMHKLDRLVVKGNFLEKEITTEYRTKILQIEKLVV